MTKTEYETYMDALVEEWGDFAACNEQPILEFMVDHIEAVYDAAEISGDMVTLVWCWLLHFLIDAMLDYQASQRLVG